MELLVFPHRNEAKLFFENFSWKKENLLEGNLYTAEEKVLLICGENPLQVSLRISSALTYFGEKIKKVFHGGVALCLFSRDCPEERVYPIRTVYGASSLEFWKKSFTISQKGLDIMSSSHRIQNQEEKKKLSHFASLLDRESYAISYACEEFQKKLTIFKYVFLENEYLDACHDIPKLSEEISLLLFQAWKNQTGEKNQADKIILPENFYFSLTMKKKYEELMLILTKQEKLSVEEIWQRAKLKEISAEKISPKEKAKKLLENLFALAYGEVYELQKAQEKKLQQLKEAGWQIDWQKALENGELVISAKIKNLEQKNKLAKALMEFYEI